MYLFIYDFIITIMYYKLNKQDARPKWDGRVATQVKSTAVASANFANC